MPSLGSRLAAVPYTVFEEVNRVLAAAEGPIVPLHQGKTWFEPLGAAEAADGEPALPIADHEHAPPAGVEVLRRRIAAELASRYGLDASPDAILVTAGATHAISVALHAVLEPGDEVLVGSPQWLFANGVVRAAGGRPIEVPIFAALAADPTADFLRMLDEAVTPRTRALYFNSPNNPTGRGLDRTQLAQLAAWAVERDVWLVADNAYEIFDFRETVFRDVALDAPDHTFSVYSFSKTYAIPGARVGFLACPPAAAELVRKAGLYSVYSIGTASQRRALRCLSVPAAELERRRSLARAARDLVAAQLRIPHQVADGGLYAWLDLAAWPGGEAALFVKMAAQLGIGLAPGSAFGAGQQDRVRLCYTAVPPDRLIAPLHRLSALYEEGPR
jgi:aspartate aminotransferase/N-succinyldiaminopimelate aminotransferase